MSADGGGFLFGDTREPNRRRDSCRNCARPIDPDQETMGRTGCYLRAGRVVFDHARQIPERLRAVDEADLQLFFL
jgi:hypothetical protein